jgi:hypothetical protein
MVQISRRLTELVLTDNSGMSFKTLSEVATPVPMWYYIVLGASCMMFWLIVTVISHYMLVLFGSSVYLKKSSTERHVYLSYIISFPHATVSTALSIYCTYFIW